jgi:hypothetical protein
MRIEIQILKNKVSETQEPKVYLIFFFFFRFEKSWKLDLSLPVHLRHQIALQTAIKVAISLDFWSMNY